MKKSMIGKLGVCLFSMFVVATAGVKAQDKADASVGADIVSAYQWRGQDLGGAAVQPYAGVTYKGFSLGAWASVALDKSAKYTSELDFTLGYSSGNFSAAITDYYCLSGTKSTLYYFEGLNDGTGYGTDIATSGPDFSNFKYFKYGSHSTSHVFEATLAYNFGPLALAWNTNFAGADYYKDELTKRAYSTYVEATAPFKIGSVDFKAELGLTPWEGAYASDLSVVNIGLTGTKNIKIADFTLPVYTKVGVNPRTEQSYVVFGVKL